MDTLRTPMTDGHVRAAESEFVAELRPLVEGYKAAKAISEETGGDESREALDRMVEVTASAYRRAAHRQMIRRGVSSVVRDVLREVLGSTYDDRKMLGMERQLYREVAEFGTGDCGAATKKEMVAQHGTELAECALSAEPEMIAFRTELNILTLRVEGGENVDWTLFVEPACNMFDERMKGGRYTPTLAPVICYEMQRASAPQTAINWFEAYASNKQSARLEAEPRMATEQLRREEAEQRAKRCDGR